jgi:predicted nucleic acid-binding protein
VLDTNVLLAAIATHGLCQALVTLVYRDHVVDLSEHILAEVAKHHRGKFKATKRQADAVVTTLRVNSEIVKPAAVPHGTGPRLPRRGSPVRLLRLRLRNRTGLVCWKAKT